MTSLLGFFADFLLNSLWQVPLLFAMAWLLARAARHIGPQLEHRVWVTALLLQALLPACSAPRFATWLSATLRSLFASPQAARGNVTVLLGDAKPVGLTLLNVLGLRIALALYALATAYLAVRFVWQWSRLRNLSRDTQTITLHENEQEFVAACRRRWHIPHVRLAVSTAIRGPITFGFREPLLLLPAAFAQAAPTAQLRATLGHELAHIHRYDFAKQLLYRLVTLPVAYHPLLWLTLSRVAESREMVCDSMAAEVLGNRKQFAHSLLEIASTLIGSRPTQSHAIGMFDAHRFERRILMLHQNVIKAPRTLRLGVVALSVFAALTTCASAVALRLHVDAPATPLLAAGDPVRVQSGIMAGQIVSKTQPKYPEEAKKAKIQGAVILKAVIGKDGAIENLQVVSGPEELRASSLDAVRQWKYKPYLLNGDPTEVETTITVTYSMGEAPADSPVQVEGVVAPKLLSQVPAKYPEDARKAKIGGEVLVALKIGENGTVSDVNAVSGPSELRAAATDAVQKYVFQPATLHGQPVPVSMRIAVNFQVF